MKTKRLTLFYFLLFVLINSATAQLDVPYSKVELTDGSSFLGYLLEVRDGVMEFQLPNGDIVELSKEEVRSVSEEKYPMDFDLERQSYTMVYDYKVPSYYFIFTFGGNFSRSQEEFSVGAGSSFSFGYQHSLKLGYGIATGIDNFSVVGTAVVYPLMLELRGYLKKNTISPYYVLQAGYGFAKKSEKLGILKSRGGMTVRPSIGLRIGGRKRGNILIELGYILQPHYVKQVFNISDIQVYNRTFNRLKVAVGVQF